MTTRKDADRPLVRCPECRSFLTTARTCPVANKVYVRNSYITCKSFAPKLKTLATKRPAPDQIKTPATKRPAAADQRHAPAPPWTLAELQACLELEDLADAVAELGVDETGAVRIRYASGADLATMNAVAALVHDAGREGSR